LGKIASAKVSVVASELKTLGSNASHPAGPGLINSLPRIFSLGIFLENEI